MESNPLVTINILSFNRKNDLFNTLTKVYEQDYQNIEVIVVDNASVDGTQSMVRSSFPSVRLIELQKNIGITGWNEGFKAAKGEYILFLDDDSFPINKTISKGLFALSENINLGIVAFNVWNTRYKFCETQNYDETDSLLFCGCGVLIQREVFNRINGYDKNYFIYQNELDFAIRAYNAGYKLQYLKDAIIYHNQSQVARMDNDQSPFLSRFRYHHHFLGYYIYLIKNFNSIYFLRYSFKWTINRLIICFKYPYFFTFLKVILKILIITPRLIKERKVLNYEVQKHYYFGNMPLIDRSFFPNFSKKIK